jgi:hypothetical protein
MAVIRGNGPVEHNPRCLEGPQAGEVATVEATFAELERLFGPADTVEEAPPQWVIRVESADPQLAASMPSGAPVARVSLFGLNMWPRDEPDTLCEWSIGAYRSDGWAVNRLTHLIAFRRIAAGVKGPGKPVPHQFVTSGRDGKCDRCGEYEDDFIHQQGG